MVWSAGGSLDYGKVAIFVEKKVPSEGEEERELEFECIGAIEEDAEE